MRKRTAIIFCIIAAILILAACAPAPTPTVISYNTATSALQPPAATQEQAFPESTDAPLPTEAPTSTASPIPSNTVTPTITLSPTPAVQGFCHPAGLLDGTTLLIGYLPEYRNLNPLWGGCLTDIIYFSINPAADGSVDASRLDFGVLAQLQQMKATYGTRIHISLGGYGRSENFHEVATDAALRETFINSLVQFARDYKLDGIDFDWEFPESQKELNGYRKLMEGVSQQGIIVSVALYPYEDTDPSAYLAADRIHIMSYNRGDLHSTYEQAVEDLAFFENLGFAREKLVLGVPFYARQYVSPNNYYTYAQMMDWYNPAADVDEIDNISFNGISTIQQKACYVQSNGYAGIMIWELGQDTTNLSTSLLQAIYTAIGGGFE